MKRLFSLALAFVLLLGLCACGGKAEPSPAFTVNTPSPAAEATPEPTEKPVATPKPAATPAPIKEIDRAVHYELYSRILTNQWYFYEPMFTDLECYIQIFPDMSCTVRLKDYYTGAEHSYYKGTLVEEWMSREPGTDLPDFLSFDLKDRNGNFVNGGRFQVDYTLDGECYWLTLYGEPFYDKVFDPLESHILNFCINTGDKVTDKPRRDETFAAAFWNIDNEAGTIQLRHVSPDSFGIYRSETHEAVTYDLSSDGYFALDHMYLERDMLMEVTTDKKGTVTYVTYLSEDGEMGDDEVAFYDYLDARTWDTWGVDWPTFPPSPRFAIIDFDGDGALEMLFEAYDQSGALPMGISQFCILNDRGEVEVLLAGELSGGTIGGDSLSFYYDNENDAYLVGLFGYAGGFGGYAEWYQMYTYEQGELTLLTEFDVYSPDNKTVDYTIDNKTVSETKYQAQVNRFNSMVMYQ